MVTKPRSLPGYSAHGIFQARILEWVAVSFSRGFPQPMDWTCISWSGKRIIYQWTIREAQSLPYKEVNQLFSAQLLQSCPTLVTPWTVARQAPLSKGFFKQEYWSELPHPPPGNLPDPGTELPSPALQVVSLMPSLWEAHESAICIHISSPTCTFLPLSPPSHPSRSLQSAKLSSLYYTVDSY